MSIAELISEALREGHDVTITINPTQGARYALTVPVEWRGRVTSAWAKPWSHVSISPADERISPMTGLPSLSANK